MNAQEFEFHEPNLFSAAIADFQGVKLPEVAAYREETNPAFKPAEVIAERIRAISEIEEALANLLNEYLAKVDNVSEYQVDMFAIFDDMGKGEAVEVVLKRFPEPLFDLLNSVRIAFGMYSTLYNDQNSDEAELRLYELSMKLAWSQSPNSSRSEQEKWIKVLEINKFRYMLALNRVILGCEQALKWMAQAQESQDLQPEFANLKPLITWGKLEAERLLFDLSMFDPNETSLKP